MEKISKEIIVPIIISYLKEKKWTNEKIADYLEVHPSSISHWLHKEGSIRDTNYKDMVKLLVSVVSEEFKDDFCEYFIIELNKRGYNKEKCKIIMKKKENISDKFQGLLEEYHIVEPTLLQQLNTVSIISHVRSLCHVYTDYIKVSDQRLNTDMQMLIPEQWIFSSSDKHDPDLVMQQNYLILNFPNSYRVALILTNTCFDNVIEYVGYIRKLKEKNNLDLMIIYTDNEVPFEIQKYYIEDCNMFFESISKRDLSRIKLQNISLDEITEIKEGKIAQLYSQLIFERLTTYFAVIRNEIIFSVYENERNYDGLRQMIEKYGADVCRGFVDKILLKEVYKYSYLSRHSIYFERTRIRKKVEKILEKSNKEKLGLVVELCYPNSFLSSFIYDKCERLLLFTSSFHSHRTMLQMNAQSGKLLFPDNVQINLAHTNPQYISSQYREIIGKADLIILGFGMGSSIVNLTEYLRHINSWLSPEGMLFISFANTESIILKKQLDMSNIFETTPLFFSDYWQYTARDKFKCLARVKRYNIEEAKKIVSTYVDVCDYYTYPFLSGLLEFDKNDKGLMDELREVDKRYAMGRKSRRGHFINIIGKKNDIIDLKNVAIDKRSIQIHKLIISFLEKRDIEYSVISHPAAVDTRNLMRTLIESGQDMTQFDLVKTVILYKTASGLNEERCIEYVVMPREGEINLENYGGGLLSEREVVHLFGRGNISPLVVLPSVRKYVKGMGNCYFGGFENLSKKYVIISSGLNSESLKIKRSIFLDLLNELELKEIDKKMIML